MINVFKELKGCYVKMEWTPVGKTGTSGYMLKQPWTQENFLAIETGFSLNGLLLKSMNSLLVELSKERLQDDL